MALTARREREGEARTEVEDEREDGRGVVGLIPGRVLGQLPGGRGKVHFRCSFGAVAPKLYVHFWCTFGAVYVQFKCSLHCGL